MNPNDIMTQQQAFLNQVMQNEQHWSVVMMILGIVFPLIGAWATYMFYARLRDIASVLMQIRILYQMSEGRKVESAKRTPPRTDDDSRYAPKS